MGFAVTLAPVVLLRPAAGPQVYVVAPNGRQTIDKPKQIVPELTVTLGNAFTTTVDVAVFMQLFASAPVIV